MKKIKLKAFYFIILSLILSTEGCIEDNIEPPFTGELNTTAELLVYLESQTDFPNNALAPAIVDAEEVNANLNSYLIVDIRPNEEFISGHIENSINVGLDTLFNFVEERTNYGYLKIILVSKNGQSSAYFTCLLRLAGFTNVYTMSFGLASWNAFFADEWLSVLGNDPEVSFYTNEDKPKNNFTPLPEITFENSQGSFKEIVNSRIKKIISQGFLEEVQFRKNLTVFPDDYLICYGKTTLLYFARRIGPLAELGHNENAVFYNANPLFELRSTESLQTLPGNRAIFIYDGTGELSACMTAYLRVLGYNAQTLLFGANQLFYSRMTNDPELMEYLFSSSRIKNYPYVTGG